VVLCWIEEVLSNYSFLRTSDFHTCVHVNYVVLFRTRTVYNGFHISSGTVVLYYIGRFHLKTDGRENALNLPPGTAVPYLGSSNGLEDIGLNLSPFNALDNRATYLTKRAQCQNFYNRRPLTFFLTYLKTNATLNS